MMLVTLGLLFGLGTLLSCVAPSILQSFRGERDGGYSWTSAIRDEKCSVISSRRRQGRISPLILFPGLAQLIGRRPCRGMFF